MSVSIILRTNKEKADGTYPLAIQIVKNRKASVIHLGHSIKLTDWDETKSRVKKSHPNSVRLNNLINTKLAEATDKALELETNKTDISSRAIKNKIKPKTGETFFKQSDSYLASLQKNGRFNAYSSDKSRLKKFKEYLGGDIAFSDISVALLENFTASLNAENKLGDRTIVNHLTAIRSVYAHARKSDLIDERTYPFGKGKIQIKFPETKKIGLLPKEIEALESAELPPAQDHARNLWLTSFYFAGARVSDVLRLKWSDFQNDRVYYTMGKNDKTDSLKVSDKALSIINKYKRPKPKHDLVFPDLELVDNFQDEYNVQRRIKSRIRAIDENLRDIANDLGFNKKLTMHISRHSFAQIAGDKISIQALQKLYRHTSIVTTIGYQSNFTTKEMDDALDNVLNPKLKL